MFGSSDFDRARRVTSTMLSVSLLAIACGIWLSPAMTWPGHGPTPDQVALQREQARARDLAAQVDDLAAQLRRPRPISFDAVEKARADDLARQVEALEAKLGIGRPPVTDGVQRSRADDLAARLKRAEEALRQPRPPTTDGVQQARADDLAAQLADLQRDPLADVTATLTKAQIVEARNLFGLYTVQSPFNYGEVNLVESTVQRKANIVGYFGSWRDKFNPYPIKNAWSRGQIPLLTWEPQAQVGDIVAEQPEFQLSRIYGGAYDEYIRSYAQGIKATGLPVVLRLAHEMNGNWYPWSEWSDARGVSVNGNQRGEQLPNGDWVNGDYVKMWRHVHGIFQEEGANDLTIWLWSPNRVNRICGQRRPKTFWPGDDVVDWIGMSGYYRNYQETGGDCDNIDATFEAVFGATLRHLRDIPGNKPILLSEIGATERGGDKAAWIGDLFTGLKANPDIIGFAWFSLAVTSGGENDRFTHDWRVNSSPESVTAMREGLAGLPVAPPP